MEKTGEDVNSSPWKDSCCAFGATMTNVDKKLLFRRDDLFINEASKMIAECNVIKRNYRAFNCLLAKDISIDNIWTCAG